jgi:hypothetical protein
MTILNNIDTITITNTTGDSYSNMNSIVHESPVNTGSYIMTTGTTTAPWITTSPLITTTYPDDSTLRVNGDADIQGDLILKGKNINEVLSKIEERLAILHPNKELEEKWDRLKSLGDMYRELEKEILEKEQVYKILKK